ncbi:MAG TPA: DUF6152 family protein [Gammaproteobacteria bacterium]|nr:DUF6152 family protein [Gammaproteobacteria bacterium]
MNSILARTLVVGAFAHAPAAVAHHSTAEYDSAAFVEAEGVVTKVLWQNPHVRLEISTEQSDGVAQVWQLEGQSPGDLDRARIPRDLIAVGDRVKFAGNPSTRRERRMYVTNVLLEDRTEIVLRANAQPRWSPEHYLSHLQATIDPARAAADGGDGIFRVWLPTASKTPDWAADPPLTPAARSAWQAFDAIRDDPVLDCKPPGMPQVSTRSGRYAIRFVRLGADLVLKNEYREIDRVIHMTEPDTARRHAPSPLGWSTGKWDGDTLVVTTTDIDWPYFQLYGLEGVPQSSEMTIVERFTPSPDGRELTYDITASDPRTFTRTVAAPGYRTFRWQPGFEFLPQNCVLDGDREK